MENPSRHTDEATIARLVAEHGHDYVEAHDAAQFTPRFLPLIGIDYPVPTVGKGYIKLHYRDFIVEELPEYGQAVSIVPSNKPESSDIEDNITVRADLIKRGSDTLESIEMLAKQLDIPAKYIGYAGLKDGRAISAQEISIRHTSVAKVLAARSPHFFLQNIRPHKMLLMPGKLKGNRFTILVRTDSVNPYSLHHRIDAIQKDGILNFFSLQRFGNRLLNHRVGELIVHGKDLEAIRLLLTGASPHESKHLQHIRREAASVWGDWQALREVFSPLPFLFRNELSLVEAMIAEPNKPAAAFATIPELIKLLVRSYGSYCFNRLLSHYAKTGEIPDFLPFISDDPETHELYKLVMSGEELHGLRFERPELPFLQHKPKPLATKLFPPLHSVMRTEPGFIFHFDLDKGSYATTFLSQIFELYQDFPVPEWVNQEEIETREPVGFPSIDLTEARFPAKPAEVTPNAEYL